MRRFVTPLLLAALVIPAVALAGNRMLPGAATTSVTASSRFVTVSGWRAVERCVGAIAVNDSKNDTRSWSWPQPPSAVVVPPSADLRRFELRTTAAGVCARWTAAAPAPPGTEFVLVAHGPFIRSVAHPYGFDLEVRENSPRVSFHGSGQLDGRELRVRGIRVGRTGPVVSIFVPRAELDRRAKLKDYPPFPYRAFSFEARLLSPRNAEGHRRADFWPQERAHDGPAAYIDGRLCAPPCRDLRIAIP
jgi:hypothetical protein